MKNLAKCLGIIVLSAVIGLSMGCNNDVEDSSTPKLETGVYLGVIGFNDGIIEKGIGLLNANTKNSYNSFITSLGMKDNTALIHAVYTAINRIQSANLPDDLINVSILTFTDGVDNISNQINSSYGSTLNYQNAVKNRIDTITINNIKISAYSIGLMGKDDVPNEAQMITGLNSVASHQHEPYRTMATNMTAVNAVFSEIAEKLYEEKRIEEIILDFAPPDFTGKIKFIFDDISSGTHEDSLLYIEADYVAGHSLSGINYQGLVSTSGTSIQTSAISGSFSRRLTFQNLMLANGQPVDLSNLELYKFNPGDPSWWRDSEFKRDTNLETDIKERSAVIMLVLDCSSSLGNNDFNAMKKAANDFIDVLVGAGPNHAQVRFQNQHMFVAEMRLFDTTLNREIIGHKFGLGNNAMGTSGYYSFRPGTFRPQAYFIANYPGQSSQTSGWYPSPTLHPFEGGEKYRVTISGAGVFTVVKE